MGALKVKIVGERMPGRTFAEHGNVHVGVQKGKDVVGLVAGDAPSATFTFDIVLRETEDGLDFRGPYVHGTPGDRFFYLSWGDVDEATGEFTMFRRAKLMLAAIPPGVVRATTTAVEAYLSLSDDKGCPLAAAVRPPRIAWSTA
ncbi:MAG: hypothetical protein QOF60_1505 [Actinomycetota bacterium]|jgi:hypothetical protein|nr:hypothetical protein [Actinomycetota bacterium]